MSDLSQAQKRGFGKRILTDSTAVFRLKDIEAQLAEGNAPVMRERPSPPPMPPMPPVDDNQNIPTSPGMAVDLNVIDEATAGGALTDSGEATQKARQIVFFAAKGGVGATTISTHVAASLHALGHRVCIVDMDLQMGGTAYALGVETTRSLANLAQAVQKGQTAVDDFPMAQHESGVYILDQQDLAEVEHVGADGLPNVFTALGRTFDFVLVDGLRDFGDHALTTMDEADEIILVTNDDVPALRCGLRAIDLFRRLGYPADRLRLLINKSVDEDATFIQTVESAYGREIDWRIPPMDGISQCQNDGKVLSQMDPDASDNMFFENLARSLSGLPQLEPRKSGFLSRFFGGGR